MHTQESANSLKAYRKSEAFNGRVQSQVLRVRVILNFFESGQNRVLTWSSQSQITRTVKALVCRLETMSIKWKLTFFLYIFWYKTASN